MELSAEDRYALYNEAVSRNAEIEGTIPHCDGRILHAPSECEYCNRPGLTTARELLGIAFTGHEPTDSQVPCQADLMRPPGESNDHRHWGGNKPTSWQDDPEEWPEESFASRVMYGEPEARYYENPDNVIAGRRIDLPFRPTKAEKRFGPWYMKPVCRNDEGTTTGYDFKWWAKPWVRWILWRNNR